MSLAILDNNIEEEVGHVAAGVKWFNYLCLREARATSTSTMMDHQYDEYNHHTLSSTETQLCVTEFQRCVPFSMHIYMMIFCVFCRIVRKHHQGTIKGPFNTEARDQAGLTQNYYLPLTIE